MVANRRLPPPPLQLDNDHTRPLLQQPRIAEKVQKASFFAQVYSTDWRKLIIIVSSINLIRFFFSALLIALSFRELEKMDKSLHSKKRTAIFAAVGLVYIVAGLVEAYGIVSTAMRRLRLIRVYVHLASASALAMTGAGVLVAYAYFEFAEDVVNQCVSIANSGKIVVKLLYRNTQSPNEAVFTRDDAYMRCFNAWSSESSSQILYVFAFYFLPSAFTCLLVYTYYRQCTDPYHPASMWSQMTNANYTRVPGADGYVSPYFSPLYNAMGSNSARSLNSRGDARSGPRRRSAQGSTSGRRSARRAKVNWFSKMPLGNNSRTSLNSAISPGPPSYAGHHLGYAYEMPYGQDVGLNSANSEGKYS